MKNEKNFRPDRIFSYFRVEWLPLAFVTLSGLIYDSLYSFRLAAVDLTGNRSGYSATFSATPQRVVETDLGVVLPGDIAYSDVGNLIPDGSFESEAVRDLRNWAPVGDGVWSFVTGQAQHGSWAYQCVSGTATQQYQRYRQKVLLICRKILVRRATGLHNQPHWLVAAKYAVNSRHGQSQKHSQWLLDRQL